MTKFLQLRHLIIHFDKLEKGAMEYNPFIISNPAEKLFETDWLIEPDSYKITYLA